MNAIVKRACARTHTHVTIRVEFNYLVNTGNLEPMICNLIIRRQIVVAPRTLSRLVASDVQDEFRDPFPLTAERNM